MLFCKNLWSKKILLLSAFLASFFSLSKQFRHSLLVLLNKAAGFYYHSESKRKKKKKKVINIKYFRQRQQGYWKYTDSSGGQICVLWLLQSLSERDISNKEVESGIGFWFLFLFVFFLFGLVCEKHVELCSFCLLKTWFSLLLLLFFSLLDFVLVKVEFFFFQVP